MTQSVRRAVKRAAELEDARPDLADRAVDVSDPVLQLLHRSRMLTELHRRALETQTDGEQLLDHVVVQIAGDPIAILEHRDPLLVGARGCQFQSQTRMVGKGSRHGQVGRREARPPDVASDHHRPENRRRADQGQHHDRAQTHHDGDGRVRSDLVGGGPEQQRHPLGDGLTRQGVSEREAAGEYLIRSGPTATSTIRSVRPGAMRPTETRSASAISAARRAMVRNGSSPDAAINCEPISAEAANQRCCNIDSWYRRALVIAVPAATASDRASASSSVEKAPLHAVSQVQVAEDLAPNPDRHAQERVARRVSLGEVDQGKIVGTIADTPAWTNRSSVPSAPITPSAA